MPDNVIAILARVPVADLEASIPLYRELCDGAEPLRFGFRGVELARVGSFLLLSGDIANYTDRVATICVRSLEPVLAAVDRAGGQIIDGPDTGPNGRRLIARHPDGSIFEYIEDGQA